MLSIFDIANLIAKHPPKALSETRKGFHFQVANRLCDYAGAIFVEDIDFSSWGRGMLRQQTLDAGFGQFFTILAE